MNSDNFPNTLKYQPEDDHEEYLIKCHREELEINCGFEVFTHGDGTGLCVDGECEIGHTRNIIVGVHGAYHEDNPKEARAAIGIYWGSNHPTNQSRLIQPDVHNNERVAVIAVAHCLRFLDMFRTNLIKNDIRKWRKAIIKTNSRYVVNCMTSENGVFRWESDDWKIFGTEEQNKDVWQQILYLNRNMAKNGLDVQFWHVEPEWNEEARSLANGVLDKA